MKIVWISHSAQLAGAEHCMVEAVQGLAARGHQVVVVLPTPGELAEALAGPNIAVRILKHTLWVRPRGWRSLGLVPRHALRNLRALRGFARLLRHDDPDVVVTNTITIPMGALVARWVGVPHVWYAHELFGKAGHDLYFDWGEPISLFLMDRLSNKVLVATDAVGREFSPRLSPGKVKKIYYAVHTPRPPARAVSDSPEIKLVVAGRVNPLKRQEDAVRALGFLRGRDVDARLTLVGRIDAAYGEALQELARELGVEERLELTGYVEDPLEYVASADVAVICSQGEAFGRVTVEAMKLGKPVVGANSAGTAELIRDGWNGLLYHQGDAEDLARKIELLWSDPDLLRALGRNAEEWSHRTYNLENYMSGLLQVFEEAVAG